MRISRRPNTTRCITEAKANPKTSSTATVTTVSGRPQALAAAPGSIYVITNDDIRRSGAKNIVEALQLHLLGKLGPFRRAGGHWW